MRSFFLSILTLFACPDFLLAHKPLKLEFIRNEGQWEDAVWFKAPMGNGAVFFESGGITYNFFHPEDWKTTHDFSQLSPQQQRAFSMRGHAWRVKFQGALIPQVQGAEAQGHYYNFRIGNDPSRWASRVGVFHAVEYTNLYDRVDMRAYDSQSASFKYDFIVHPGGNPAAISLSYQGLDGLHLSNGDLVLATSVGEFIEQKPFAYQVVNGKLAEVPCRYVLSGQVIRFEFPEGYDTALDLVIDPTLIAATLSGSTSTNYGHTATYDIAGNIYTGCISFGVGYPTTDGAYQDDFSGGGWGVDMAFSKLSSDGAELYWASYLGGTGSDYPHSMFANDFGELYILGSTDSADIPVSSNAYQDANQGSVDIVLAHFFEDGTDVFGCTYIGGSTDDGRNVASVNYGDQYRGEIILDNSGNPMVASFSTSTDFPVTAGAYQSTNNGGQDAVIFRFNQDLSNLMASSYIGSDSDDSGFALRQNALGDVYLAGMAGDANFPVTPGAYQTFFLGDTEAWGVEMDGFVSKFNASFTSLLKSTYFATDKQDEVFFLDLDNNDDVYIYGQGGSDIPIVGDVYSNPGSLQFVSKLDADLENLVLSTQIGTGGGTGWFDLVPIAFLVDHCNNVYISGHGCYGNVPITADALYDVGGGGFYLAVLTEDMADLEYGTMYTSGHVDGGTSRFDKNGTVYQGVCSGGDFATTPGAWATDQIGGWDIGVFKIDFDVSGVNSAITGSDVSGCAPFEVEFSNYSTGDTFFWDFGDGNTSTEYEPQHVYLEPGAYQVSLIATDSLSCNIADTSFFDISISTPLDYLPDFTYTTNCATLGIECTNTTGYDFLDFIWDMGDGTIIESMDAEHFYDQTGTYSVSLTAIDNGCNSDSTVTVEITIFDEVVAIIGNADIEGCAPFNAVFENNSSGVTFSWDFGDGSPLQDGATVSHVYEEPGLYDVILYAVGNSDCPGADTAYSQVEVVEPLQLEALFTLNQVGACEAMTIEAINQSEGEGLSYFWNFGDGSFSEEENPVHFYGNPGSYTVTLTISQDVCSNDDSYDQPVVVIDQLDLELAPDIPICYYEDNIVIQAAEFGPDVEYSWSTGATTSSITVDEPGSYTVEVGWNQCIAYDTVTVFEMPQSFVEYSVEFCEGTNALLTVPYEGSTSYTWCNGETGIDISVGEGGEYCYFYVDSVGCLQEGVVRAIMNDYQATLYVPNAFTPNSDGINDVFRAEGVEVSEFEMRIFNRWGDLIFETTDFGQPWDGSYRGKEHYVPDGVYPYIIRFKGPCAAERVEVQGMVVIIR